MESQQIDVILDRAWNREGLKKEELTYLLSLRDERSVQKLFNTAKGITRRSFGANVFLSGFVYFSTYCKNNCSFCFYRRSNHASVRYRKAREEIITLASSLADAGVHMIDLTMGEDPAYHDDNRFESLLDVIRTVDETVDIPIMVSPGVVPRELFRPIREAGGDWFACYQETHNRQLFSKLRPDQDFNVRMNQKIWARDAGILTEEGIMIGVGETIEDRANSIVTMGLQGVRQVRAMTFVPQDNTPMQEVPTTSRLDELVTIAVMRLVHQDKLIPASLDIEGIKGLKPRLDAGANLITSIIPPEKGLAGVAQHELDIENGERSPQNIEDMLAELDISVASISDYRLLVDEWKEKCSEGEKA